MELDILKGKKVAELREIARALKIPGADKLKKKELRKWYSIIAASRLADNVPNEEQWLIKIIRKNINYLKKLQPDIS